MLQTQALVSSIFPFSLSHHHHHPLLSSPYLPLLRRPITTFPSVSVQNGIGTHPSWLAEITDAAITSPPDDGPLELPSSTPSIFATDDDPSTIQVATSILLTGAITVFLFRSLRRRAKRARELKFRSSGAKKSLKEEAIESLKAMTPASVESKGPPSPAEALLGGLSAGIIALILYKFTTTVEASLNRQTLSDNFSVRQITITIRTIINGLCYLATFVFGINSMGLVLYSGQLAINSLMGASSSTNEETQNKNGGSSETNESSVDQSSENTK